MNPTKNSSDNLFLRGHASLRNKRISLPGTLVLLALVPLVLAFLALLWFGQYQLQRDTARQADAIGVELSRQIAMQLAEPLAARDTLSLNISLAQWAQNPLVAHASLADTANRTLAEAGRRPSASALAPGEGHFIAPVHMQDELVGQLHLSLARDPFLVPAQRMLEGLQWSLALLVLIAGLVAWRFGAGMRRTLAALGNWYGDSDQPAPGIHRPDELGDLARRLAERRITDLPPLPEPEPEPEPELELEPELEPTIDEEREPDPLFDDVDDLDAEPAPEVVTEGPAEETPNPSEPNGMGDEAQADRGPEDIDLLLTEGEQEQAAPVEQQPASAVLAIRLDNLQSLHRLPRPRLLALLEHYRSQLEESSRSNGGELHTLMDGSSVILFHPEHPDPLGAALCCGELMRVVGHNLQIEIADTGIALHIQIALCHTPCQGIEPDQLQQHSEDCAQLFERMQHSRNLLLLDSELAGSGLLRDKAVLRRLASQPNTHCVERLLEPYQGRLQQQLNSLGSN